MKEYGQFHDGFLDGLWIDGDTAQLYLRTAEGRRFVATSNGVVALDASGFRAGNIVLSVSTRNHDEIDLRDIRSLYDLRDGPEGEEQSVNLLAKARNEKLTVLEVTPSYGACCLVLTKSVEIRPELIEPQ
jgi:hypothetical protein